MKSSAKHVKSTVKVDSKEFIQYVLSSPNINSVDGGGILFYFDKSKKTLFWYSDGEEYSEGSAHCEIDLEYTTYFVASEDLRELNIKDFFDDEIEISFEYDKITIGSVTLRVSTDPLPIDGVFYEENLDDFLWFEGYFTKFFGEKIKSMTYRPNLGYAYLITDWKCDDPRIDFGKCYNSRIKKDDFYIRSSSGIRYYYTKEEFMKLIENFNAEHVDEYNEEEY